MPVVVNNFTINDDELQNMHEAIALVIDDYRLADIRTSAIRTIQLANEVEHTGEVQIVPDRNTGEDVEVTPENAEGYKKQGISVMLALAARVIAAEDNINEYTGNIEGINFTAEHAIESFRILFPNEAHELDAGLDVEQDEDYDDIMDDNEDEDFFDNNPDAVALPEQPQIDDGHDEIDYDDDEIDYDDDEEEDVIDEYDEEELEDILLDLMADDLDAEKSPAKNIKVTIRGW